MKPLILVRHGESQWNLENRFTGWHDVDLTANGIKQAQQTATRLRAAGLDNIDIAYSSMLKRAIRTLWIILDELDRMWIETPHRWQLNERHYGALQGLNKAETAQQYGDEQVHIWRRSYATPPDPMSRDNPMHPQNDPRYAGIDPSVLPATESLHHVRERILPLWQQEIAPLLTDDNQILIAAHGNSLRALVMYLRGMNEQQVMDFNIPTGVPLVLSMVDSNHASDMRFLD